MHKLDSPKNLLQKCQTWHLKNNEKSKSSPTVFLTPGASSLCTQMEKIWNRKGSDTQEYLRVWSSQSQEKRNNENKEKKRKKGRKNNARLNRGNIKFNIPWQLSRTAHSTVLGQHENIPLLIPYSLNILRWVKIERQRDLACLFWQISANT